MDDEKSSRSLKEILQKIENKIESSSVLNGGFDKLSAKVDIIYEKQEEMKEHLEKMNNNIYDPDKGLFSRVKNVEFSVENLEKENEKQQEKESEKEEIIKEATQEIHNINITSKKLMGIAGENLEELDSLIKSRKKIERFTWLLITAIAGTLVKTIWDLLVHR